ncbi:hypothetical protein ACU4GD_25960 [Cupriavidus basilensis]
MSSPTERSCRHQIHDGTGTPAVHVARLLASALDEDFDALLRAG